MSPTTLGFNLGPASADWTWTITLERCKEPFQIEQKSSRHLLLRLNIDRDLKSAVQVIEELANET